MALKRAKETNWKAQFGADGQDVQGVFKSHSDLFSSNVLLFNLSL